MSAQPRREFEPESSVAILAFVGLFALMAQVATLPMVETGGDAVESWLHVKRFVLGAPVPVSEWNHRTVRFGILLPVYLVQVILGTKAWVYSVTPVAMSVAATVLVFRIATRRWGAAIGALAAASFVLFPEVHLVGAQQKPEIFSLVYMLGCVDAVLALSKDRRPWRVVVAAVFFFFAYWTKLPNLFFIPGLGGLLYAVGGRRKEFVLGAGVLLGLIGLENGGHVFLAGQEHGRLSYSLNNHLQSPTLAPIAFSDLFRRYTDLVGSWAVLMIAFSFASAAMLIARKRFERTDLALLGLPLGFVLLTSFAVKSIDPLVPVQPFRDRYLCVAIPGMIFALCSAACVFLRPVAQRWRLHGLRGVVAACVIAVTGLGLQVAMRPVPFDMHPLVVLPRYEREFTAAYEAGDPIISTDPRNNALRVSRSLFWSPPPDRSSGELPRIRRALAEPRFRYIVDEQAIELGKKQKARRRYERSIRGQDALEAHRLLAFDDDGKLLYDLLRFRVAQVPQRP